MLKRQQAQAMVAARTKIVSGATDIALGTNKTFCQPRELGGAIVCYSEPLELISAYYGGIRTSFICCRCGNSA